MLDIIFTSRNKKYGAYALRRNYDRYLGRALLIGLSLIAFLYAFPMILSTVTGAFEKEALVEVEMEMGAPPDIDPDVPPPPPPPEIETPPPPTRSTVKFVPPIVKKDEEVVEEKPQMDLEELKEVETDIGKDTKEGDDELPPEIIDNPDLETKVEVVKAAPVVKEDAILDFVEKSASFPGGDAELMKYLQQNIVYPAIARENNITGRVALRFVVEKDGSITNVEVVRKLGGGTDEEAVRVVKSMPKWIPANQNGRTVRQRYVLPVFFKLAG